MINVSTSCLKDFVTIDAMKELRKNGIRNIELSGCPDYLNELEAVLIEHRIKYDLNFICHNYFSPSRKPHKKGSCFSRKYHMMAT